MDLGIKGRWRFLTFEAHAFSHWIDDLIALRLAPADRPECEYVYDNVAAAWLLGVEGRVSARLPLVGKHHRVLPALSATWIRGADRRTGDPLAEIPPLRLAARLRHEGRLGRAGAGYLLEGQVVYLAPQRRVSPGFDEPETPSFALVDLAAGVRWAGPGWFEAALVLVRVTNVADARYRHHLSWALGRGRDVRVTLRLDF